MTIIISTTWLKSKQIYKSQQSIDIEYLQKREQQRQKKIIIIITSRRMPNKTTEE